MNKINHILNLIGKKDVETYEHLERTALFAFALGKALRLAPKQLELVYFAGLLHDIGALEVDRQDKCSCATYGYMMLRFVDGFEPIAEAIKCQYDDYERLIRGDDFTALLSRVIALVSEYDELRNVRKMEHETVLSVLLSNKAYDLNLIRSLDEALRKEDLLDLA